tara:strand:+ start:126 stop:356 length:231 start_codon:yes stop_codon:yes gene_type:complete
MPCTPYLQEIKMKQEKHYEKEELDFRSTKEQCIRNNTDIEHGETIFTKKETNTVIQISWTRYGKYVEVDYWMEALQ